ncbi:hypothetical protein JCM11491_005187 [Sporobolomyces phaffii]
MDSSPAPASPKPVTITPQLALELRLRFLESLVSSSNSRAAGPRAPTSLARRVSHVEAQLKHALEGTGSTDAVRRFVQNYELNAPLLSAGPVPAAAPDQDALTVPAKVSLILEAELELRTLERDLRDLDTLHQRGVVEAGRLAEHEPLREPLAQLVKDTRPVSATYASLEDRTTSLLRQYNDYITDLSELFVDWNDLLTAAEDAVAKLEKRRHESLDIS